MPYFSSISQTTFSRSLNFQRKGSRAESKSADDFRASPRSTRIYDGKDAWKHSKLWQKSDFVILRIVSHVIPHIIPRANLLPWSPWRCMSLPRILWSLISLLKIKFRIRSYPHRSNQLYYLRWSILWFWRTSKISRWKIFLQSPEQIVNIQSDELQSPMLVMLKSHDDVVAPI